MKPLSDDLPLLSLPMGAVLLAQFFSAFGDNALLITAIALVKADGHAGWIPLLQAFFVIPFILLAPFVGALADAFPKGRVMLFANGLKLVGAASMAAGAAAAALLRHGRRRRGGVQPGQVRHPEPVVRRG